MRLTQGQFSFLPDLTDSEISLQIDYALSQGWAIGIEYTNDPHPRNTYWTMWMELTACRKAQKNKYIRLLAFDANKGFESVRMSFLTNRPDVEPGFELVRSEGPGRQVGYTIRSYATEKPDDHRYEAR